MPVWRMASRAVWFQTTATLSLMPASFGAKGGNCPPWEG
jgi:hypothetical protein